MSNGHDSNQSEASDESSESELLDKSLSLWKGWGAMDIKENFEPVPLDLHTACSLGLLDTVKDLVASGVDLDSKNKGGWTPLMYSCYIGHYTVVDYLLASGVDMNVKNMKGQTPLILAASCGNESVGHLLCAHEAQMEARDNKGATALLHATYSGHQNMVLFLLEQGANINKLEPTFGVSPLMQAAAEGHEIIVQIFLNHGVDVEVKAYNGDTARSVALLYGHTKIVSLIDNHVVATQRPQRADYRLYSEGGNPNDPRIIQRSYPHPKTRPKEPNIRDGPEAFARYLVSARSQQPNNSNPGMCVPQGYLTFNCSTADQETTPHIRSRDMTSPINPEDYTLDSSGEKDCLNDEGSTAFSTTGAITIKSSSSSSGGLAAALGISREGSEESLEERSCENIDRKCSEKQTSRCTDNTHDKQSINVDTGNVNDTDRMNNVIKPDSHNSPRRDVLTTDSPRRDVLTTDSPRRDVLTTDSSRRDVLTTDSPRRDVLTTDSPRNGLSATDSPRSGVSTTNSADLPLFYTASPLNFDPSDTRPKDLERFLEHIGLSKYMPLFVEQDVDFPVFLSLTENHLSEIGVKLFGHRRKMAIAITRWHRHAPQYNNELEQVYANRFETEMQNTAAILNRTHEQMEELQAQLSQEEELRAVTESCLMEEKGAWQRVRRITLDISQNCHDTCQHLSQFKIFHDELLRRLVGNKLRESSHDCNVDVNSLTAAIKDSFSLDDATQQSTNIGHTTNECLILNMDPLLSKIKQCVIRTNMTCEVLMCQTSTDTR